MKRLIIAFGIVFGFVAFCSRNVSYEPPVNYGWTPPVPPEEREYLYGDADESLKAQAPELFVTPENNE